MGTSTILDIIGSMTTFGLLLLATLRLNASASESNYGYIQNYLLQRNMIVLTVMLEQDLNNIGVGANDPYGGIQVADRNRLQFSADLDRTGGAETVEWRVGLPSELTATPNPRDCYVYRTANGKVTKMNLGVTQLEFHYWRVDDPTVELSTVPIVPPPNAGYTGISTGNIGPVEVSIRLESPYKMKSEYKAAGDTSQYDMVWRQMRSVSRNNQVQFP